MTLFLVILVFIDISNISNTRSCSLFSPVFLSSIYLLYFFISLFLYIGATLRPAGPICVTVIANHYSYALRCLLMTVFFPLLLFLLSPVPFLFSYSCPFLCCFFSMLFDYPHPLLQYKELEGFNKSRNRLFVYVKRYDVRGEGSNENL